MRRTVERRMKWNSNEKDTHESTETGAGGARAARGSPGKAGARLAGCG